jgi:hypothetical protein
MLQTQIVSYLCFGRSFGKTDTLSRNVDNVLPSCVTSKKSEGLIYNVAEARNHVTNLLHDVIHHLHHGATVLTGSGRRPYRGFTITLMHKYLIDLSIYFCFTRFGLSFSPSSEAGVQLRQWFKSPGYGVSGSK